MFNKLFNKKKSKENASSTKTTDITSSYDIGKQIGKCASVILNALIRGAFSIVKEATQKETGVKYAIKFVSKKYVAQKDLSLLMREIEIMKKLRHDNIVQLIDVAETVDDIYIVMELVNGGELFNHIVERGFYSEHDASIIIRQLCEAVDFMHKHGVAHRDLKPQNLLCTPDGMTIKIADFGLSKMFNEKEALTTACGTPDYVAPEILLCKPYSNSVDVWAVGVITYILLCGFTPFYAETHKELFEKIMKQPFEFPDPEWTDISNEAKDFISHLMEKDPEKRWTAEQAIKHPWLQGKAPAAKLARIDSFKDLLSSYNATRKKALDKRESASDEDLIANGL